jgi:hypothetical protein
MSPSVEGRFHTRATEVLKRGIRLSGLENLRFAMTEANYCQFWRLRPFTKNLLEARYASSLGQCRSKTEFSLRR